MCTESKNIKFCTCVGENLKDEKNIYIWSLYKYLGVNDSKLMGKILMPSSDLQNGISVEKIISKLNQGNIFDFDYTSSERDTLNISYNAEQWKDYKYFTLIYRKGAWQEGSNSFFSSTLETIAEGRIEILSNDTTEI